MATKSTLRYFPTERDLRDPRSTRSVLQQILIQHYALQDSHDELKSAHDETVKELAKLKAQKK
jgi:hypothetical protein